jgi:hypothetical protein
MTDIQYWIMGYIVRSAIDSRLLGSVPLIERLGSQGPRFSSAGVSSFGFRSLKSKAFSAKKAVTWFSGLLGQAESPISGIYRISCVSLRHMNSC